MNEPQGGKYFDTQKEIKRLLNQTWESKLQTMFIYEPDVIQIIIVNNPNIQN